MPVTSTKKILASGAMLKAFLLGSISVIACVVAIVHARHHTPMPMLVPIETAPAATEIPVPDIYLLSPADETPATQPSSHAGR